MRIHDYDMEFSEVKNATWITASFKDFDGDAEKWREAYFSLLAWKNTWGVPYKMDINADHNHEAFLMMVIPEQNREKVLDMLEDLGYRKVNWTGTSLVCVSNFDPMVDWVFED